MEDKVYFSKIVEDRCSESRIDTFKFLFYSQGVLSIFKSLFRFSDVEHTGSNVVVGRGSLFGVLLMISLPNPYTIQIVLKCLLIIF